MSPSRKRNKNIIWFVALFLTVLLLALGAYYFYAKRKLHGDLKGIELNYVKHPVRGIDVSHFTGKVDFARLQEQNMKFAYLRATYGLKTDKRFEKNYENARRAEMPLGAYHYLRFELDGLKQAQHYLKKVKGKKLELPHVLDVEEWGNSFLSNRGHVVENIRKFITEVEKKTGTTVMIYTNESGYRKYIQNEFEEQPLWICSFNNPPNIEAEWLFWQHSHIGRMDGAEGWLDYNVFNGNERKWKRFLQKNPKK
jgi:lysozyme